MDRALCHGLLELVQRDGNSAGYRAVDRHIKVELDDGEGRRDDGCCWISSTGWGSRSS